MEEASAVGVGASPILSEVLAAGFLKDDDDDDDDDDPSPKKRRAITTTALPSSTMPSQGTFGAFPTATLAPRVGIPLTTAAFMAPPASTTAPTLAPRVEKASAVRVGASPIVPEVPAASAKENDNVPRRSAPETRAYAKQMRNVEAAKNPIEIDMEESADDNKEVRFGRKGEAMDCDVLTPLVFTDTLSCDSFSAVLGSREASCRCREAGCT
jgi:hypothetical protein